MVASHDVVLVGGGGAGLRAAIAIAETNPRLSVAVVSKVYPMRSHTVSAEGGAAGVIRADDSLDEHGYDTISGGDWLCDQDAVEAFVKEAPEELLAPGALGLPLEPRAGRPDRRAPVRRHEEDAHVVCRRQDRLPHAAHALPDLAQVPRVVRYDEWFVTKLLVDDGRVQGVVAIELMSGKIQAITAKAGHPVHGRLRPGLPLHDQRHHQERRRHGAGLPGRRAAQGHGVRPVPSDRPAVHRHPDHRGGPGRGRLLINKDGYRYLQDYNLGKPEPKPVFRSMELGPRDRLSQAFVKEVEKGRTIDTPYGPSSISTCATWARRSSTPRFPSCASCA